MENPRKNSRAILFVFVPFFIFVLSGCAAIMALSGKKEVNLSALRLGQDRAEVIDLLGKPAKTVIIQGKKTDVFELQRGNAPNASRAVGHGAMDILTFGMWELVGTPVEATQGESFTLTTEYDESEKLTRVIRGKYPTSGG